MTFMIRSAALDGLRRVREPFFGFPFFQESQVTGWNPPVDVMEENDRILVKVEVPGVEEKNLGVTFEDGYLTITGERHFEKKEESSYHRIERAYGSFTRTFSLPRAVDPAAIVANYSNGVLEIEIPKKAEARARQIAVNVGAPKQVEG